MEHFLNVILNNLKERNEEKKKNRKLEEPKFINKNSKTFVTLFHRGTSSFFKHFFRSV